MRPHLPFQTFRARAKKVGADLVSKLSWDSHDVVKRPPYAEHTGKPTFMSAEEWEEHEAERIAQEKNLDHHLEFDDLMDLSLMSDLADCSSVRTGCSELIHHTRTGVTFSQLNPNQPKKLNKLSPERASSSCPPWRPEPKPYSTNRGPHMRNES